MGPLVQATLTKEGSSYIYTLPDQRKLEFNKSGQLARELDRNGNAVTLTYNAEKHLESAVDSAGRKLTFTYNSEGLVESVKDPMGHTVRYTYEAGNLATVTQPAEATLRWQFNYDSEHELTSETDGRGHVYTTEYDSTHRVKSQTDPLKRTRKWEYAGVYGVENTVTTITEPNEALTRDEFNMQGLPISVTHAYGSAHAATTKDEYDINWNLVAVTDPDGHKTEYGYDSAGNKTSEKNADGDETTWKYDGTHDIESETTPGGEKTTIKRDSHGNPESISRPAPSEKVQSTKLKYASNGQLESITDPLERTTKYGYDSYGDRTSETDPEGDKRTWSYNEDSQETSTVSPRGNATGGEPANFTTTITRDAQGRPTLIREPGTAGTGEPADKTASSIMGSAQEGQTLSANTGIWAGATTLSYAYQWRHCNSSGESCTSISGATSATYALTHSDVSYTIRVVVTATNALGSASSTSAATPVVAVPVPAFFAKFGVHGSGESELAGAKGIAPDGKGDVVVSDEGSAKVKVFKENGEFVKAFGSYGSGVGQLKEIKGIAVDSKGNVWVADQGNSVVSEFNEKGEWQRSIGTLGSPGSGASQFKEVKGVAVDSHNNVWVADTGNNRVEKFNEKGELLGIYGWGVSSGEEKFQTCTSGCRAGNPGAGHGQFSKPRTLAADAAGDILVTDTGNNRVEKINEKGEYVLAFGESGSGNGQFYEPIGITVDSHGNVWVTDAANSRIEEFSATGEYLTQFGSAGSSEGQFNEPWSIVVNSHSEIFVSDSANYRIQKFAPSTVEVPLTPAYVSKFGTHGSGESELAGAKGIAPDGKGDVVVSDEGSAKVKVFKENGEFVKAFGSYGSGVGQLKEIKGIAVDSKGNVWVADQGNSVVSEFNEKGEWQRSIGTLGSPGSGASQFKEVKGVAVDSHNNVWVADTGNNRVEKFNEKGELLGIYGWGVSSGEEKFQTCTSGCRAGNPGAGHGQFSKPRTLAADAAGDILVTDTGNNRVEKINEKGEYVLAFGESGSGNGQFYEPIGITVDSHGNVWVTDAANSRIEDFSATGEYLTQFGSAGSANGQFNEPWSIVVNSHSEIFVSDSANYRIQKFAAPGTPTDTSTPSISGELLSGQTLHASTGNWAGAATITYSYQWEDCNTGGEACTSIPSATTPSYVLAPSDIGHTLRVAVTATNPAGSLAATASVTEAVAAVRTTQYTYDGDGNLESVTDAEGHKTTYTYDADNELTRTEEPNKTVTEAGYDADGRATSLTDGNKNITKYTRNLLGEVTETIDPRARTSTSEYDPAGNLKAAKDAAGRTTTYSYDAANRLKEITYSDGKTPAQKYEYDSDGKVTHMTDGTGETTNTYDQLDRLTATENGHKEKTGYEYDLANELTKLTYPNGKAVTRSFDKAGRLEKITDWLENTSKFSYNPDSEQTVTTYPASTSEEDQYSYNEADQITEIKMNKGAESLASLGYTRDNHGQVKGSVAKGLPGEEIQTYEYDANSRLKSTGPTSYEYDAANNPTKLGSGSYTYDKADELETGPSVSYSYNEVGQRTKTTPTAGSATTYTYDEAGNLTTVERPKEGETPAVKDSYIYDGTGLRASQTVTGTTTYLVWSLAESVPLLLSDGTNSYIYGPLGLPVEQINNSTGAVLYLHHDQQGSTRLLTSTTGAKEASFTYDAYGNTTGTTGTAKTPLGYDGQSTSSDTGLIYLHNRVYDPKTAQFLSVDPIAADTGAPYFYGADDPVNYVDPSGLDASPVPVAPEAPACLTPETIGPCLVVVGGGYVLVEGAKSIIHAWGGEEPGNDEGEALLKQRQAEEGARKVCSEISPNFNNPAKSPGEGWEWKGNGPEGSSEGSWVNPETGEKLYPDLNHPEPLGPHYDYTAPDGSQYRIYPDGRIEPKE